MRATNMKDMIDTQTLKFNGWTAGLIKKFLPEHDQTKPNPVYKSGAEVKLYNSDRVKKIEASAEFVTEKAKTERRQKSAEKAVETKLMKMNKYLENLTVEVVVLDREELTRCAKKDFYSMGRGSCPPVERLCVNFLRHCGTKYEAELDKIAGKVGSDFAYYEIKQKVLEEIAKQYGWLAEECDEQLEKMFKAGS